MKVEIEITCCGQCPYVKTHADHPVSDEGICFCEYRCGKVEWPHKEFSIPNREIGKIHKDCPLKAKTKIKSKKESK